MQQQLKLNIRTGQEAISFSPLLIPAGKNGSNTKGWYITVNTSNFQNLSVSFWPESYNRNGQDYGPRDWKMQYSPNNSSWTDVGAAYTAQDNWANGPYTRALPPACNNQATLYLRWVMTSNTATDGGAIRGIGSGPASAIGNIKVTGSAIAMAPTNISLSASQTDGIGAIGRVIGTLTATDVNECESHTFSLVAGTGDTDNANYQIVGNTLKVNVPNLTGTTNSVLINAYDGVLNYAKSFTINVAQPSPPTDILLSSNIIWENAPVGTIVGTLSSVDVNAGETYTYSLVAGAGDTDNSKYEIVGNLLKSKVSPLSGGTNSVRINSNDGYNDFAKSLTINISNYCPIKGLLNADNYITNVKFNGINQTSGLEPTGYGNYTSTSTTVNVNYGLYTIS